MAAPPPRVRQVEQVYLAFRLPGPGPPLEDVVVQHRRRELVPGAVWDVHRDFLVGQHHKVEWPFRVQFRLAGRPPEVAKPVTGVEPPPPRVGQQRRPRETETVAEERRRPFEVVRPVP